jgi:hypothetical protein
LVDSEETEKVIRRKSGRAEEWKQKKKIMGEK